VESIDTDSEEDVSFTRIPSRHHHNHNHNHSRTTKHPQQQKRKASTRKVEQNEGSADTHNPEKRKEKSAQDDLKDRRNRTAETARNNAAVYIHSSGVSQTGGNQSRTEHAQRGGTNQVASAKHTVTYRDAGAHQGATLADLISTPRKNSREHDRPKAFIDLTQPETRIQSRPSDQANLFVSRPSPNMLDNDIGLSVFSPSIVSAEAKPSTASRLPLEQLHENKIPEIPFFTLNKPTKFTAFTRKRGRDESQSSASVTPSAPSQVEPPSKKIVSTKSVSVLAPNIGISVDEIKMAPSHPSPETAVRRFQKLPQVETPVESPFPPNLPKYDETPILAKTLPVKRKTPQTVAFLVQETPTESPVQPIILIPNSLMNSMTPPTRRSNNGVEKTPFFSEKRNRIAERKTPDFSTQAVLSYEALDADEFTQLHPSVAASVESPEAKIELGPPLENPALTALILVTHIATC